MIDQICTETLEEYIRSIQPEVVDLLADFVFRVRRLFPRLTLSFVLKPPLVKRAEKLNDYLVEKEIRQLAPRYFDYVISICTYSDWELIFRKAASRACVNKFVSEV